MVSCVPIGFSNVLLFSTPWIVVHQAPLSMGCSTLEYWYGMPCPTPGDLPNPGIEPVSLRPPALVGGFFITSTNWEAPLMLSLIFKYFDRHFAHRKNENNCINHSLKKANPRMSDIISLQWRITPAVNLETKTMLVPIKSPLGSDSVGRTSLSGKFPNSRVASSRNSNHQAYAYHLLLEISHA